MIRAHRSWSRPCALLVLVGSCCLFQGVGPVGAAEAPPAEVKIDNFSFAPATLKVAVGTVVTWVNHDDIPHTVVSTATPAVFKSHALDTDDKFTFRFEKAGTYPYFCSLHPKTTGTVTVQ
jgi:plastocyanin